MNLSNCKIHNEDGTPKDRQRSNTYLPQANLTNYQKAAYYSRIKIFSNLPLDINPLKAVPEWPRGFQEVKVPRFHDNGTGWW